MGTGTRGLRSNIGEVMLGLGEEGYEDNKVQDGDHEKVIGAVDQYGEQQTKGCR